MRSEGQTEGAESRVEGRYCSRIESGGMGHEVARWKSGGGIGSELERRC